MAYSVCNLPLANIWPKSAIGALCEYVGMGDICQADSSVRLDVVEPSSQTGGEVDADLTLLGASSHPTRRQFV